MHLTVQVILGMLALASLLVLVHYLATTLLKPSLLLNLLNKHKGKPTGYLYYALLFSSWITVAFVGAKMLLFWIPDSAGTRIDDGTFFSIKDALAGLIACFSVPMIRSFEEFARTSVRLKYLDQEKTELAGILKSLHSIDYRISNYEHLHNSADQADARELYGRLLQAARELQLQLKRKIENAKYKEMRIEQDQRKLEAERRAAEKEKIESLKRLEALRLVIGSVRPPVDIPIMKSGNEVDSPTYTLLSPTLLRKKWAALDNSTLPLLEVSDRDFSPGMGSPIIINPMLESWSDTRIIPDAAVVATHARDGKVASTSLHAEINGQKYKYLNAFRFGTTLEALIEAFFVVYQLPTKGHNRRGLQGHDYTILIEQSQLVEVLHSLKVDPTDPRILKLNRPCGIRVARANDSFRVRCLAAYPDGTLVDFGVRLASGRVHPEPAERFDYFVNKGSVADDSPVAESRSA